MYLVGDRIKYISPENTESSGTIELIEESLDGHINYVIQDDNGYIAIRNSENDDEVSLIQNNE
jgi:Fe-S cluster biogenesis protein NfuA